LRDLYLAGAYRGVGYRGWIGVGVEVGKGRKVGSALDGVLEVLTSRPNWFPLNHRVRVMWT
jgi:hypothetical protein